MQFQLFEKLMQINSKLNEKNRMITYTNLQFDMCNYKIPMAMFGVTFPNFTCYHLITHTNDIDFRLYLYTTYTL